MGIEEGSDGSFQVQINGETYQIDPHSNDGISVLIMGSLRDVRSQLSQLAYRVEYRRPGIPRTKRNSRLVRMQLNAQELNLRRQLKALKGDAPLQGIRDSEGIIVGVRIPEDSE